MPNNRRRWLTEADRNLRDRLIDEDRKYAADHTAKYGVHVCTPDPADPWSTCHLITSEATA